MGGFEANIFFMISVIGDSDNPLALNLIKVTLLVPVAI